jgi:7,8-dihydro-6-hydroxymethylpterin-pyrophosphokinase
MKELNNISVILPVHNWTMRQKNYFNAVESVKTQNTRPDNLIIVY